MSRPWAAAAVAASMAAVAVLAGCSGSASGGSTPATSGSGTVDTSRVKLTYVSYGGTGQQGQIDAFQIPYTAAHPNVTFANTSPADVAQAKAQVLSGNVQWDLVSVSPGSAEQNCGTVFAKLDVPAAKSISKDLAPGTVGNCYVGDFSNATLFGYNKNKWPDPATAPKTIADFFDTKKFPGKRGMLTTLQNGLLEYPLLADGVQPKDLYPLDVNRALKKLDTIKSDTIFGNVGTLQQAIASNQVDMYLETDSRLISLMDAGQNIGIVWDKTLVAENGLAIVKGSRHQQAAEQFLGSVVQPTPQALVAEKLGVAPVNLTAKPHLTTSGARVSVYGKANTGTTITQNVAYYGQNFNQLNTQVTNWLAG